MARGIQIDFLLAGVRDSSGQPLANGLVYTYSAGTTTARATYTDAGKTTVAANPIELNELGQASVFGDSTYKFVIQDSLGNTIATLDNLYYIVAENSIKYAGLSAGPANTYNLTVVPAISTYTDGDWFRFIAHQDNTGASTASASGLSSKTIKKDAALSNLAASDIVSNGLIDVIYDEANDCFRLVSAAAGVWSVGQGGTGASDAATARTNLGAAKSGANQDITSIAAPTSDGSDTGSFAVGGGGTPFANGRGGRTIWYGADHATDPGRVVIAGDGGEVYLQTIGAKAIGFWVNATQRWEMEANNGHLLPIVDDTQDIGSTAGPKQIRSIAFSGQLLPATRQDYDVLNKTINRGLDCNAAFNSSEWANVLDVLGTLIDDLISIGLFQ